MTNIQIADLGDGVPDTIWDPECNQWLSFDINELPHWDNSREEAKKKAIEANNIFFEHLAKCPSDEVLLLGYLDWKDDPVNYKCYGG